MPSVVSRVRSQGDQPTQHEREPGSCDQSLENGRVPDIAVFIVADVRLYRDGLSASLRAQPGLLMLGATGEREAALRFVSERRPDVIVLDMATRDALALVRALAEACPAARIVAFAIEEREHEILVCAEAGVAAWVGREGSVDDLVRTIKSVVRDELFCSPQLAATLFRRLGSLARGAPTTGPILTPREREVVTLIELGCSNKEIAHRLHIEVATVKNHVHNVLEKLHVTRRGEAAAYLQRLNAARAPRAMYAGPTADSTI